MEKSTRSDVQIEVITALSKIYDEDATRAIINALKTDFSDSVITDIFINCKLKKKTDLLLFELCNNVNANVRKNIATILGEINANESADPLIQALKDQDVYVRIEAANALAKIKDKRAVSGLAERLNDDISDVRSAAQKALKIIAKPEDLM